MLDRCVTHGYSNRTDMNAGISAHFSPISSNGGRKISLFERRNFNEGNLFIFFFLDERTSYMMVSYSVKKKVGKRNVKFRRSGTLNLIWSDCVNVNLAPAWRLNHALRGAQNACALKHKETPFLSSKSL